MPPIHFPHLPFNSRPCPTPGNAPPRQDWQRKYTDQQRGTCISDMLPPLLAVCEKCGGEGCSKHFVILPWQLRLFKDAACGRRKRVSQVGRHRERGRLCNYALFCLPACLPARLPRARPGAAVRALLARTSRQVSKSACRQARDEEWQGGFSTAMF